MTGRRSIPLAICFGIGLGVSANPSTLPQTASVKLDVPAPIVPVLAAGRLTLVYELHVTNDGPQPLRLERLEVRDTSSAGGALVASYGRTELERDMKLIGPRGAAAPKTLSAGVLAVVFVWLTVDSPSAMPRSLVHRVVFADRSTADGAQVSVRAPTDLTLRAPVDTGDWWIGLGPSNTSEHRRAVIRVGEDPVPHLAQRFGIDWVKVDARGEYARDRRGRRNEDWYGYGGQVFAAADARVAAVVDGLPENTPGEASRAIPMKVDTVIGNYVLLDLGGGHDSSSRAAHWYALYGHLQPGSLQVKIGDAVHAGQLLGLIGNSGNSDGPHLHFHVTEAIDAASAPLRGEGVPFLLDAFTVVNHDPDRVRHHGVLTPLGLQHLMLPVEGDVVRIGGARLAHFAL